MLKPGIWRHWKGDLYRVFSYVKDSTNGPCEGRTLVLYLSLTTGKLLVREAHQFNEHVWLDDADDHLRGDTVPPDRVNDEDPRQAVRFNLQHPEDEENVF